MMLVRPGHGRTIISRALGAGALAVVTALSGCFTTMGYVVGSRADNQRGHFEDHAGDPDDPVRGLAPDERVRVRCRDGSEKEGTIVGVRLPAATSGAPSAPTSASGARGAEAVLVLSQASLGPPATVPLGDISTVGAWRRPASGRTAGVVVGVAVDALITVLIVRSTLTIGNIGPIK